MATTMLKTAALASGLGGSSMKLLLPIARKSRAVAGVEKPPVLIARANQFEIRFALMFSGWPQSGPKD
jgi:hypothetical protein